MTTLPPELHLKHFFYESSQVLHNLRKSRLPCETLIFSDVGKTFVQETVKVCLARAESLVCVKQTSS